MGAVRETNGLSHGGGGPVGGVARGSIDIILIDVAKLLVHGVGVERLALVRLLLLAEVTRAHQLLVRPVGYHCVAPPVRHRPHVIVVVVCHCIPYLQFSKLLSLAKNNER